MSDRDLSQMDTDYLDDLPEDQLRSLSKQLLTDLKEARERLKQNPDTSSRPPSSREPWKASEPRDVSAEKDAPVAEEEQSEGDLPSPGSGEQSLSTNGCSWPIKLSQNWPTILSHFFLYLYLNICHSP